MCVKIVSLNPIQSDSRLPWGDDGNVKWSHYWAPMYNWASTLHRSQVYTLQIILEGSPGPHPPGNTEKLLVQQALTAEPGSSDRSMTLTALDSSL